MATAALSRSPRADLLFGGIALAAFGSVGLALLTQYQFDMQPCPWCVLQRLIAVVVGLAALLGLAWRSGLGQRVAAALVSLLAVSGIAAALWQHFVAAASASCAQTFADRFMAATGLDSRWPEVFAAYASCAEAKVDLLGVPYEFWSLALFVLIDGAATLLLLPRRRG